MNYLVKLCQLQEKVVVEKENENESTSPSADSGFIEFPNKDINKRVALASALAAVGFFIFTRLDFGVSLKDLSAAALPYEEVWSFHALLSFYI